MVQNFKIIDFFEKCGNGEKTKRYKCHIITDITENLITIVVYAANIHTAKRVVKNIFCI